VLLNYHIGCFVLVSFCVGDLVRLGLSGVRVAGWSTTDVVMQQNSRKLLMMDILMPETCWAHKKWNKIASDIKLVFYSSNITMIHGPINIRTTEGIKCDNCRLFALFVSYKKCILTQKIHPEENINVKYYYPTCTSNLLCTILCSFIHGLSGSAVCRSNVKTEHVAVTFISFLRTYVL